MHLTNAQTRHLRGLAHHLKPVLQIGDKGITPALLNELDQVLNDHELIKVSIAGADRETRRELTQELCQQAQCQLVQIIGRISVLYRRANPPAILLP
ncbi:ribosome assembly RNA-binding protein YhbY [Candidatus Venteria ishoeyi]|uniref:RNA-binding protein n=1 Tax=Candidatus Venteria ishoeyi TaxID=1899563 RepID=A0A1H6FAT3_9GAMM|nr:ribosome assembly RNA-binding protein YhbY [Candidatus Venteria ishoeyi]MDM8545455.1 ribosome assembly RNA-binding protein YhbY [Candidatus Venteria ishoeyi]SEH06743.1 RNA-binding protein [Candidatus Venteria ishoeyi]